jgi:hypothetical protein
VVVTGYAGQLSLAQYAIAGCGGYVAARLAAVYGLPFPLALVRRRRRGAGGHGRRPPRAAVSTDGALSVGMRTSLSRLPVKLY